MTEPNSLAGSRRSTQRIGIAVAISLIVAGLAGWYWHTGPAAAQDTAQMKPAASTASAPVNYPEPGKEPKAKTEFPSGATPITGPEIAAALSDHTALLPGGFVEYYAPNGKIHGLAEGKHYGGSWDVRNGDFCTLLQDSSDSICSPVERKDGMLYWSTDGEKEASQVIVTPGNPRNLQ